MNMSSVFTHVAYKKLVAVDLPDLGSNQHELNGVSTFREFFRAGETTRGTMHWHYLGDDVDPCHELSEFTFYDARAKSASRTGRSEWRFYYYGDFLAHAAVGDWLFLARTKDGQVHGFIFERDSAWARAARVLFGVMATSPDFVSIGRDQLSRQELEVCRRQMLDEVGLQLLLPSRQADEQLMLSRYGRSFPPTKELSDFARTQVQVDTRQPDEALLQWLDREERLFRALENVIVGPEIKAGFSDVDSFIKYSLSVQNRRKSRMGHALQNHLEELFLMNGLRFTAQAKTEGYNRPDFIFPGEAEYHNPAFDDGLLLMLGVKSTSKDRWRQVLDEADRVKRKHLCTLEAGISVRQTESMLQRSLVLVVPERQQATYTVSQRRKMLSVASFIELAESKQSH